MSHLVYEFGDDGYGQVVRGRAESIKFDREIFVIEDQIALYKTLNRNLFPEKEFEQWVLPRMQKGQPISVCESIRIQWNRKYPNIIKKIAVLGFLVLIVMIYARLKIKNLIA